MRNTSRMLVAGWVAIVVAAAGCGADIAAPAVKAKPGTGAPSDNVNPPDEEEPPPGPFSPAEPRLRRLQGFQYKNAIIDLLGADAASTLDVPADVPISGLNAIGASQLAFSPTDIDKFEENAFAAAQIAVHGLPDDTDTGEPIDNVDNAARQAQPVLALPAWRVCTPTGPDDSACMESITRALGKRAFRRPLAEDEAARWTAIGVAGADAYQDFNMGLEYMIAGLLQSPHFLYIVEEGVAVDGKPDHRKLTGYEMAARLSFFLLGTTPSPELMNAAEAGELDDTTGLRLHALSLLQSPAAKETLREFMSEKFVLGQLDTEDRNDPFFTPAIRAAMKEELLRNFDDVVWDRNADAREIFGNSFTFANDALATYYGIPLPGTGANFARVQLDPSTGRGGILTSGAFLAKFARNYRSSPTLRGKFIRESMLCGNVPAPPDNVSTALPPEEPDGMPRTTRDQMDAHVSSTACAGCHAAMDPLGYALEGFDQFGRHRTHENGLPVNTNAVIDGVPVADARELGQFLASSPKPPQCLVRNIFRFASGHVEEDGEDPSLELVFQQFEDSGFRLQDALLAIVTADAFRYVKALPQD